MSATRGKRKKRNITSVQDDSSLYRTSRNKLQSSMDNRPVFGTMEDLDLSNIRPERKLQSKVQQDKNNSGNQFDFESNSFDKSVPGTVPTIKRKRRQSIDNSELTKLERVKNDDDRSVQNVKNYLTNRHEAQKALNDANLDPELGRTLINKAKRGLQSEKGYVRDWILGFDDMEFLDWDLFKLEAALELLEESRQELEAEFDEASRREDNKLATDINPLQDLEDHIVDDEDFDEDGFGDEDDPDDFDDGGFDDEQASAEEEMNDKEILQDLERKLEKIEEVKESLEPILSLRRDGRAIPPGIKLHHKNYQEWLTSDDTDYKYKDENESPDVRPVPIYQSRMRKVQEFKTNEEALLRFNELVNIANENVLLIIGEDHFRPVTERAHMLVGLNSLTPRETAVKDMIVDLLDGTDFNGRQKQWIGLQIVTQLRSGYLTAQANITNLDSAKNEERFSGEYDLIYKNLFEREFWKSLKVKPQYAEKIERALASQKIDLTNYDPSDNPEFVGMVEGIIPQFGSSPFESGGKFWTSAFENQSQSRKGKITMKSQHVLLLNQRNFNMADNLVDAMDGHPDIKTIVAFTGEEHLHNTGNVHNQPTFDADLTLRQLLGGPDFPEGGELAFKGKDDNDEADRQVIILPNQLDDDTFEMLESILAIKNPTVGLDGKSQGGENKGKGFGITKKFDTGSNNSVKPTTKNKQDSSANKKNQSSQSAQPNRLRRRDNRSIVLQTLAEMPPNSVSLSKINGLAHGEDFDGNINAIRGGRLLLPPQDEMEFRRVFALLEDQPWLYNKLQDFGKDLLDHGRKLYNIDTDDAFILAHE